MRDTLLLIGNGLAIDYRSRFREMPNPSRPLDFPLLTPGSDKPLCDTFVELWETIEALRAQEPGIDDFSLMRNLRLLPKPPLTAHDSSSWKEAFQRHHVRALKETQMRLHLTHAYVHFTQLIIDAELRTWRWYQWLLKNRDRLYAAVSFNYDLLFETTLESIVSFDYLISRSMKHNFLSSILVFKPHGSVNFEFPNSVIQMDGDNATRYEKKNVFELFDAPIRILHKNELDQQRLNSDIVLPTEASQVRGFQYITPGFELLRSNRDDISRCVIIGLSYWDCDRPEIDEILNYLGRDTQMIICNPNPPKDLESKVIERFHQVEILKTDLPL